MRPDELGFKSTRKIYNLNNGNDILRKKNLRKVWQTTFLR